MGGAQGLWPLQRATEIAAKERVQAWAEVEHVKQASAAATAAATAAARGRPTDSNTRLQNLQQQVTDLQAQLSHAHSQNQALQGELEGQRKRVRTLQETAGAARSPGSAALTNKKDEDDVYDIEAAVLTGAGGGFKPLSGAMRGAVFPLNSRLAVAAARRLDKLAVAVDRRPLARGLLVLYFVLLHALLLLF